MCKSCHVVTVKTELNDLHAIANACKRMGWKFMPNKKSYAWVGSWYDDTPVPRLLFDTQEEYQRVCDMTKTKRCHHMNYLLGTCDHAIQIPGCRGEIGIIERNGKYIPIWDYFAHGLGFLDKHNVGMSGFLQAYGIERTILEAQRQGQMFTEQTLSDGSIQLRIQLGDL